MKEIKKRKSAKRALLRFALQTIPRKLKNGLSFSIALLYILISLQNALATEKSISLLPNLKVGDEWNMIFEENHKSHTFARTSWQYKCVGIEEGSHLLKITLSSLKVVNNSGKSKKTLDTDYPFTNNQQVNNPFQVAIGKSFTVKINFSKRDSIQITKNDFNNRFLYLTHHQYTLQEQKFGNIRNPSINVYPFIDPENTLLFLDYWRGMLPFQTDSNDNEWPLIPNLRQNNFIEAVRFQKSDFDKTILISNKIESKLVLDKTNNIPTQYNLGKYLNGYSYYSNEQSNTIIEGDFANSVDEKSFTLEFYQPAQLSNLPSTTENKHFKINLNLKEPSFIYLKTATNRFPLFVVPGNHIKLLINNSGELLSLSEIGKDNSFFKDQDWYAYSFYENLNPQSLNIIKSNKQYNTDLDQKIKTGSRLSPYLKRQVSTDKVFGIGNQYINILKEIRKLEATKTEPSLDYSNLKSYLLNYIDSIPKEGNYNRSSFEYTRFIKDYLNYSQIVFYSQFQKSYIYNNPAQKIDFANAIYTGLPYYLSVYQTIESNLYSGKINSSNQRINDFMSLPCSDFFKTKISNIKKDISIINNGEKFPIHLFQDKNDDELQLPKTDYYVFEINNTYSTENKLHTLEKEALVKLFKNFINITYISIRPDYLKGKLGEIKSNDTVKFIYFYEAKDEHGNYTTMSKTFLHGKKLLVAKDYTIINNNVGLFYHDYTSQFIRDLSKQAEIKRIRNKVKLKIILKYSLYALSIILTIVLYYRIRTARIKSREARKRQLAELELKAIRSQMNPHFVFNAMGSIQNLMNQNNIKNANIYLSRFAKLMRLVLNTSNQKLITLSDELDLLNHYLELEQLRVNFNFTISVAEEIDIETEEIPGMLIQPFVENAVIHGITPKGGGNIEVNFVLDNCLLVCEIIDDGVGINNHATQNGNGLAMKLSEKRLDILNSNSKDKVHLRVENRKQLENKQGTKITLSIPIC